MVLLVALLAGCGSAAPRDNDLRKAIDGAFGGYVSRGHDIRSIHAQWVVPGALAGSPPGIAATWIGAQVADAVTDSAFVQIGTNEHVGSPNGDAFPHAYYAFWSSDTRAFHPQLLLPVAPGDVVTATIVRRGDHWHLAIDDTTSGQRQKVSVLGAGDPRIDQADWTQEDVTDARTGRRFEYPQLAPVTMSHITLNDRTPAYSGVYATWLTTAEGVNWAPTPLEDGAFTLHRVTVTPAGQRYMAAALPENAAIAAFASSLVGWTPSTPSAQIVAARSALIAALRRNVAAFGAGSWPAAAAAPLASLRAALSSLIARTEVPVPASAEGIAAWTESWIAAGKGIGTAALAAKRAIGLPELRTSTPDQPPPTETTGQ